jgi:hypothetical protein
MDLCEFKNIIDLKDMNEINKFKEIFTSNIKYPALFGKIKLNNESLIKAQLAKVNNNLNSKLNDIENYLKLYPLK